ncbi:MAG: NUDIX domain-containing protein [Candidatus Eremiobacteraeota bacterium]|nr:NUDIX domain-containing protein [Candidatus Eremiobacteraeota bacterium]
MIHLATGLAIRDGRVLLVASHYPNHAQPLWNLPGGRQQPGELLAETVVREFLEETGLCVGAGDVAYVSESYDGAEHFLNVTFLVALRQAQDDNPERPARSAALSERSESKGQGDVGRSDRGDHVVEVEWVAIEEIAQRIVVAVVREPLIAYLHDALPRRYAGYHEAGVRIEWPADSQ